ncbi:MAG: PAS domain-containing protein, partial [Sphingomonas sp.]|nr:PAS domain-containing protein [Sphingomonas sp.]
MPKRASVREALWFDVKGGETSEEDSLTEWRIGNFDYAALLLGATHLLIAAAFVVLHPQLALVLSITNPFIPLALVLTLDVLAALGLHWRDELELSAHTVARAMCFYLGAVGLLWTLFSVALIVHDSFGLTGAVWVSLCAGITMAAIVAISSPPLSVVNAFVATAAAALFASATLIPVAVAILCLMLTAYSVAGARTVIAAGRRRLSLDGAAHKTLNFVDEFENTGRGWFWETNPEGTLSYVSQQLADDFRCEPAELLGRQFTDLLSVDTGGVNSTEERKTLGFHLSARFPFSDVVVRPASDQDVHWSLSGNPIFDSRGRFLGFRGIGTDLTEQRRSEREITRLARFDSLTGLPNRAM